LIQLATHVAALIQLTTHLIALIEPAHPSR